jgi:amidase
MREVGETAREAPFAGVPILVKDLMCDVAGLPASNGNAALKQRRWTARRDSVLVDRLRSAGFVVLGSSTTAEFGATISTETSAFGACPNPRATGYSSGGSSGGAAAAVAAGLVPVAHGNDASGSLRIPSAFCGVLGFKPARGRIDDGLDPGSWFGLAVHGPVARSVRDLRSLTRVLAGETGHSIRSGHTAAPARLRVGVLDLAHDSDVAPTVRDAVHRAAECLCALGHVISPVDPATTPFADSDFGRNFALVAATGVAMEVARAAQRAGVPELFDQLDPPTAALVGLANRRSALDFARSHAWLMDFRAAMRHWWRQSGLDVLLTPVTTAPAPALGELVHPVTGGRLVSKLMKYTAQLNVTGDAAVAVPSDAADGLPIGVQLVAAAGTSEDQLLAVAEELA